MTTLEVTIKNNMHYISCNEGEEGNLRSLAQTFKAKVDELSILLPNADDKTLYLIAGLMFLDKLEEQAPGAATTAHRDTNYDEQITAQIESDMDKVTETLEKLAEKLAQVI